MDKSSRPSPGVEKDVNVAAALPTPVGIKAAPAPEVAWAGLIGQIAGGQQAALAKLYDQSASLVYGLALRVLNNPADAEEVTLDVYSQVWRSAAAFDPARGSAMSWLVMIARSRAIDRVRRRMERSQREQAMDDLAQARDRGTMPDEASVLNQRRQRVQAAMQSLPGEQRELIELAFFLGCSHSEIAERTGTPLGTVKTRLRLGMMKLREQLAGWEVSQ
jgi:RNA polymerase sigma-70 factor (ECF subfamily)